MYINTYYHAEDMILYRYVYTSRSKVGSKIDVRVPFPMTSNLFMHTGIYSSNFQEKGKKELSLTYVLVQWESNVLCPATACPEHSNEIWVHAEVGNGLRLPSLRRIINNLNSELLAPPQVFTEDRKHPSTCVGEWPHTHKFLAV